MTNQNPNSVRRRFAPPHTIWVLYPNKNGDSYKINVARAIASLLLYQRIKFAGVAQLVEQLICNQ